MKESVANFTEVWTRKWISAHPVRSLGIVLHLLLRTLFAIFWLAAGINKVRKGWLTEPVILENMFLDRLTEMPPDAFATLFLQNFAIPLYPLVAWVITLGELYSAVGLLIGITTRPAAGVSLFILAGLATGGYYDASLIPFFLLNFMFLAWPSGLWLGLDRRLAQRHPQSRWFR
ncbi:MAG: DoxX family membrane protein [Gammaproteobacteria bacterium]|nr:DoxX family membrane protein [Gammaproteobacteria bacterium]